MVSSFEQDPYPGNPKILFVGLAQSTHTHTWIDLLSESRFNVRLFALENGLPPSDWPVKTYATYSYLPSNPSLRKNLYFRPLGEVFKLYDKLASYYNFREISSSKKWLSDIIKHWKPDIIQTLGFFDNQGGQLYFETRKKYGLEAYGKWVLQLRGGSDLALRQYHPEISKEIRDALLACDQILSDNRANIRYAGELGVSAGKFASITPIPGTGGVDLIDEEQEKINLPSRREHIILWPKAYESQWSKALPVFEAIRIAWEKIQPCEIHMLAMTPDVYEWYLSMPEEIRKDCHVRERIPRHEVLALMKRARILLAPSLVDGIPNSLYEAMANGAFPVISPLETIMPVVSQPQNVLFARNLYPDEIANALIRGMNDDKLVDEAVKNNFQLVQTIANRQTIRANVVNYYKELSPKL